MECFTVQDLKKMCKSNTRGIGRDEMCQQLGTPTQDDLSCLDLPFLQKISRKMITARGIQPDEKKIILKMRKNDLVNWLHLQLQEGETPLVGAQETHTCGDGTTFECAGGSEGCMNNSPSYCPRRGYDSLGWIPDGCPLNIKFEGDTAVITDGKKTKVEGYRIKVLECTPQPSEFKQVAKEIAEAVVPYQGNWSVDYHEGMPGIQFINNKNSKYKWESEVTQADNHWTSAYGGDYEYCMCRENNMDKHINESLLIPFSNEEWWAKTHGHRSGLKTTINEDEITNVQMKELPLSIMDKIKKPRPEPKIKLTITLNENKNTPDGGIIEKQTISETFKTQQEAEDALVELKNGDAVAEVETVWKKLSDDEKQRIRDDVIRAVGKRTYKIHFQPKVECQIPLLRRIMTVLNRSDVLPYVKAAKAIIPYNNVIQGAFLPSIVVYPVEGKVPSQRLLNILTREFSNSAEECGLNIVPRFNHRYDHLIYWANGDGDIKESLLNAGGRELMDIYFDYGLCEGNGPDIPYCHYHHWRCPDNDCHIEPEI